MPPEAVTPGGVVFDKTVVLDVAVQPFTGFLVVSTYTPATEAEVFWELDVKPPGPDQEKVMPAGEPAPFS